VIELLVGGELVYCLRGYSKSGRKCQRTGISPHLPPRGVTLGLE